MNSILNNYKQCKHKETFSTIRSGGWENHNFTHHYTVDICKECKKEIRKYNYHYYSQYE